jgi:hypothetical protein
MTLVLTSADQQALARASRLLTSPLDHPSADAWRAAVNRELEELMVGDSAAFILPEVGGPVFFSEEHEPAEGAKYVGLEPPALSTGQSMWSGRSNCAYARRRRSTGVMFGGISRAATTMNTPVRTAPVVRSRQCT